MANTITQRTLFGSGLTRKVIRQVTIVSDGTQETDLVIYDNSAFRNDPLRGSVLTIEVSGSDCTCLIEWDQTTDAMIAAFNPAYTNKFDFRGFGGIVNPGGAGATGDILLTTTGLANGEVINLVMTVRQ